MDVNDLLQAVARGETDWELEIWTPPATLALSRLDELRPGVERARELARAAGFEPVRRVTGGHAVVLGSGSFCVGFAEPAATFEGAQQRYERLTDALVEGFADAGIAAVRGELEGEWCPGAWSIRAGGVKLAGLAQRAIKGAAWVEAVVALSPDSAARALLAAVYEALELPLDTRTIGSVTEVAQRPVAFDELAEAVRSRLG
jgi:octanoyl-[GcvH]:protein N-octanoyltransferase